VAQGGEHFGDGGATAGRLREEQLSSRPSSLNARFLPTAAEALGSRATCLRNPRAMHRSTEKRRRNRWLLSCSLSLRLQKTAHAARTRFSLSSEAPTLRASAAKERARLSGSAQPVGAHLA
jgi:hypothetical protein